MARQIVIFEVTGLPPEKNGIALLGEFHDFSGKRMTESGVSDTAD